MKFTDILGRFVHMDSLLILSLALGATAIVLGSIDPNHLQLTIQPGQQVAVQ